MGEDGVGNFKVLESRQIENIPVFQMFALSDYLNTMFNWI